MRKYFYCPIGFVLKLVRAQWYCIRGFRIGFTNNLGCGKSSTPELLRSAVRGLNLALSISIGIDKILRRPETNVINTSTRVYMRVNRAVDSTRVNSTAPFIGLFACAGVYNNRH